MKVIIAGSRNFKDYSILEKAIKESGFKITTVVSGGAPGVDKLGEEWAVKNKIPIEQFPADWNNIDAPGAIVKQRKNPWNKKIESYNANAGFARNIEMAEFADALIAIDLDTNGTNHMIKTAKEKDLKVFVYSPEKAEKEYIF